jgi:hypothetical protein
MNSLDSCCTRRSFPTWPRWGYILAVGAHKRRIGVPQQIAALFHGMELDHY